MDSIAYCPSRVTWHSGIHLFMEKKCPYFVKFGIPKCVEEKATMRVVLPTKQSIMLSLQKCDKPMIYPVDELQSHVENLACKYFESFLKKGVLKEDQEFFLNLSTSPGSELKRKGYKTKSDAIKFGQEYLCNDFLKVPINDYNHKVESLEKEEIENFKIRGTFNPQLRFLLSQKFLFDNQNSALTEAWKRQWIKCGFVKEYGGFNRLGKYFEKYEYVLVDDVKGFDRSIPLIGAYRLRKRCFTEYNLYSELYDFVEFYTLNSYVYCPDGVVRVRKTGNSSGSNNTTHDNSLAHAIIKFRMYAKAWNYARGLWPTLQDVILNFSPAIYSDDVIEGLNLSDIGISLEDYNVIKHETYAEFGLELHADCYAFRGPFGRLTMDLSFLGSRFHFDSDLDAYIPYPNLNKICSSLIYVESTKISLEDTIDKVFALACLSTPNLEIFSVCLTFLKYLISIGDFELSELAESLIKFENPRVWFLHALGKESRLAGDFKINNMSKAIRAEKKIERMSKAVGCHPDAIEWMECALDPFPDEERKIAGYPDMIAGKSVVQAYRQQVTVVNANPGAAWDCHIIQDGFFRQMEVVASTTSANAVAQTGQGATPYKLGGLQIRQGGGGGNLPIPSIKNSDSIQPIVPVGIPFRVIASGFEVINTTAPLYKSGNVIVWRQPRQVQEPGVYNVGSTVATANQSVAGYSYQNPPESQTEALILQGSQSWEAEKGCYCVQTLCQQDITLHGASNNQSYNMITATSNGTTYATIIDGASAPYSAQGDVSQLSFNQSGALFTGLHDQSSLVVVWHYVVERFPRAVDVDLITMSSNSSPFDPRCLELYSKTAWHLPPGVVQEANGLGDWLSDVADILGSFGVPGMGIAKGLINGVQHITRSFDENSTRGGTQTVERPQMENRQIAVKTKVPKMIKQQQQIQSIPKKRAMAIRKAAQRGKNIGTTKAEKRYAKQILIEGSDM